MRRRDTSDRAEPAIRGGSLSEVRDSDGGGRPARILAELVKCRFGDRHAFAWVSDLRWIASSRMSLRTIFPVAPTGRSATKSIVRGFL
jgi:hypothetical protein